MNKQSAKWWITGALVIICLSFALWSLRPSLQPAPKAELHSSPTAVRPWAEDQWNEAMKPAVTGSSWKLPVSSMVTNQEEENERIVFKSLETKDEEFIKAIDVLHVDLTSPDSPLTLEYISTCYVTGEEDLSRQSVRVENQFFSLLGKRLSNKDLNALNVHNYRRTPWITRHNFQWPQMGASLQLSDHFLDPKWCGIDIFDASTHVQLNEGMSYSSSGSNLHFSSHLKAWHDAEVVSVIEAAHGPVQHTSLDVLNAKRALLGDTQTTLLGVYSGGRGNSMGWSDTERYFSIDRTKTEKCLVALEIRPITEDEAFTFTASDSSGAEIECSPVNVNDGFAIIEVDCPAEKLSQIHLSYRPNRTRFIIPLGKIPGLPQENQGIKDLLDVTIPYTSNEHNTHSSRTIATRAAQIYSGTCNVQSPRRGTDITPRQQLRLSQQKTGEDYQINTSTWTLEDTNPATTPASLPRWRAWLKKIGI